MDGWMDQGVGTIHRGFSFAEASHTGAKVWDSLPDNNVCPLCATWRQQTITSSTKQWRQSVGNIPALPVYMNTKKNWFISRWYRYIFSAFTSICHISSKRNCFKISWIDGRMHGSAYDCRWITSVSLHCISSLFEGNTHMFRAHNTRAQAENRKNLLDLLLFAAHALNEPLLSGLFMLVLFVALFFCLAIKLTNDTIWLLLDQLLWGHWGWSSHL